MNRTIHIIAKTFDQNQHVGAQRPSSFYNYLIKRNKNTIKMEHKSFIKLFIYIIKNRSDIFLFSVGPYSIALPFLILSIFRRLDFVCDIRDPLYFNILSNYGHTVERNFIVKKFKEILSLTLESLIFKFSRNILVCTPGTKQKYSNLFPKQSSKISLVFNGHLIQKNEVRELKWKSSPKPKTKIVCLGKFFQYGEKNALKVLNKLINEMNKHNIHNYELTIIGEKQALCEKFLSQYIEFNFINTKKRIPLADVHQVLLKYDLAAQVIRDEEIDIGTKFYNYIAAGLPIVNTLNEEKNAYKFMNSFLLGNLSENSHPENFNRYEILKDIKFENLFD
jgi:hypothetical protein